MNKQSNSPSLSVVVAVYNEDPRNLLLLLQRLAAAVRQMDVSYEVIFVNDGSNISTSTALREIAAKEANVTLIELSRNFGQQAAISAGMNHANGQAIINLDSDLQDPPELIPEMVKMWLTGYDVVYAQRSTRRDRLGKRLSAFLFYRLLDSISDVHIPRDTGDFRLIDRKVRDALRLLPEKTRFLRGLIPWLGFKQVGIPIDRDAREVGKSTYTLRKLISLALDGMLSFSLFPLYFVLVLGTVLTLGGIVLAVISLLVPSHTIAINTMLLIAILVFIAGLETVSLGILAIYLGKVLDEVRSRPTYIVADYNGQINKQTRSNEVVIEGRQEISNQ